MATLSNVYSVADQEQSSSLYSKFIQWAAGQEESRFMWLGVALGLHGCFLTPAAIFTIVLTGAPFGLIIASLGAMVVALVSNLAALPTKITLPLLFLSILASLGIIATALLD